MDDNYIDFLESKGVDAKVIAKIQKHLIHYGKIKDGTKKIKFIYEIMSYAGLSLDETEELFDKCISIISLPYEEITKIAYCLWQTNSVDEIFDTKSAVPSLCNYKRLFMRYLVIRNSKFYNYGNIEFNSYFMAADKYFYGAKGYKIFEYVGTNVSTDDELEHTLNKMLTMNGKSITVDKYIEYASKKFYLKYLKSKKNKDAISVKEVRKK